jgi:hypothetical protein
VAPLILPAEEACCIDRKLIHEVPSRGILRSSLPASNDQATPKITHLGDILARHTRYDGSYC